MKEAGTYYILNTITGDRYDGSSVNINNRWYNHRRRLNVGKHENEHLQRAWNKYGADAFSFRRLDIMDGCSANEVRHKEQMLLDYKRATKNLSYNISTRAECPSWTDSQRNQMSLLKKAYWTEERKEKRKGRKHPDEVKAKIASTIKAQWTDERRAAVSAKLKGNQNGRCHKKLGK